MGVFDLMNAVIMAKFQQKLAIEEFDEKQRLELELKAKTAAEAAEAGRVFSDRFAQFKDSVLNPDGTINEDFLRREAAGRTPEVPTVVRRGGEPSVVGPQPQITAPTPEEGLTTRFNMEKNALIASHPIFQTAGGKLFLEEAQSPVGNQPGFFDAQRDALIADFKMRQVNEGLIRILARDDNVELVKSLEFVKAIDNPQQQLLTIIDLFKTDANPAINGAAEFMFRRSQTGQLAFKQLLSDRTAIARAEAQARSDVQVAAQKSLELWRRNLAPSNQETLEMALKVADGIIKQADADQSMITAALKSDSDYLIYKNKGGDMFTTNLNLTKLSKNKQFNNNEPLNFVVTHDSIAGLANNNQRWFTDLPPKLVKNVTKQFLRDRGIAQPTDEQADELLLEFNKQIEQLGGAVYRGFVKERIASLDINASIEAQGTSSKVVTDILNVYQTAAESGGFESGPTKAATTELVEDILRPTLNQIERAELEGKISPKVAEDYKAIVTGTVQEAIEEINVESATPYEDIVGNIERKLNKPWDNPNVEGFSERRELRNFMKTLRQSLGSTFSHGIDESDFPPEHIEAYRAAGVDVDGLIAKNNARAKSNRILKFQPFTTEDPTSVPEARSVLKKEFGNELSPEALNQLAEIIARGADPTELADFWEWMSFATGQGRSPFFGGK